MRLVKTLILNASLPFAAGALVCGLAGASGSIADAAPAAAIASNQSVRAIEPIQPVKTIKPLGSIASVAPMHPGSDFTPAEAEQALASARALESVESVCRKISDNLSSVD